MANSPNKGYTLQAVGANSGTWGTELNDSMISIVDRNLGGVLVKNISTTGDVTLTNITPTWEAQQSTLVLTGNPAYVTYPTITISTPAIGFLFVQNNIVLNGAAYPEIRIKNSSNATYAVVPANSSAVVILDATYGARLAGQQGFASGTALVFSQASAPTGWTKSTTNNNKALRIVSGGTGGTAGGTTPFTSVFAARTLIASNLPDHSVTVTDPGHNHGITKSGSFLTFGGSGDNLAAQSGIQFGSTNVSINGNTTGITAAFGTTARGSAQTSIDFDVQYVDVIVCTKD